MIWALLALACSPPPPPSSASSDPVTLVIGVPQSRQIDPSRGSINQLAGFIVAQRLTGNDASGRVVPRLLESWSQQDDGLTWRLVLRPGLLFHDGTPLTSGIVKQYFDDARSVPRERATSACLADITGVDTEGPLALRIRLMRRCAFLLDDVTGAVTKQGEANGPLIGTGPFRMVSSSKEQVTLEANPRFYLGAPRIAKVVVRMYDTLRTAWADMLRGRVDFLWDVGPDTVEFLRDQRAVEVRSFLSSYAFTIIPNSAKPAFRDPAVRRALNMAIDRRELVELGLKGQGRAGSDPIWPSFWARDAGTSAWQADPPAAARLLAQNGRRGLTFTCLVPEGFTLYERLALLVQRQLRAVDVDMRLEALSPADYNRRIVSGNFDAVLMNLVGGPYQTLYYAFWHSPDLSRRWNFWGYSDPGVDAALEAMRSAANETETRSALRALGAAFHANPPAIVLVWSETLQAVNRRFDITDSASGTDALSTLARWSLRAPPGAQR